MKIFKEAETGESCETKYKFIIHGKEIWAKSYADAFKIWLNMSIDYEEQA